MLWAVFVISIVIFVVLCVCFYELGYHHGADGYRRRDRREPIDLVSPRGRQLEELIRRQQVRR